LAIVQFSRPENDFFASLRSAVNQYFEKENKKQSGDFRLYLKTIVFVTAAIAVYAVLMLVNLQWYIALPLAFLMGLLQAFIGFNVMHDACHGSYSSKKKINDLFSLSMNALGSDAFMWKQKHNIVHHTYTNIDGVDDDIQKAPLIRMAPTQPHVWAHRLQFLYIIPLYAVSTIFWLLLKDIQEYFAAKAYNVKVDKMKPKEHVIFWISKVLYIFIYIVVPIFVWGWFGWLMGFIAMHVALGLTLSLVFQLAHVVENVEFEHAHDEGVTKIESEWAVHQLKTTSDFAVQNKFVSWFLGGLNYQVEHHLFPRISHVHYPAIQQIVAQVCAEYNVAYHSFPTTRSALASHFRHMYKLGKNN